MTQTYLNNFYTKNFNKITNLTKKHLKGGDLDKMINITFLHLSDNKEKLNSDSDIWNWIISYVKSYWWKGHNYSQEDSTDLEIKDFKLEYEEEEYNEDLDKKIELLEKKLKDLPYEYKILFTLIFHDGVVSNVELGKVLNTPKHNIAQLKKNLKIKLGIDPKKHWRKNEIKDIWKF